MDVQPGDGELADRISRDVGFRTNPTAVISAVLTAISEALAETTDTPEEFAARLDRLDFVWFRQM